MPHAQVLTMPRRTRVQRHRIVLEIDSARSGKAFKAAFKEAWARHEFSFPGTRVFMSHELITKESKS